MQLFVNDYITNQGCSCCRFKGFDRVSDFTLGDFWGIWDVEPDMDDNKGTSLVITHSEQAERILQNFYKSNKIRLKELTKEDAVLLNRALIESIVHKPERDEVLKSAVSGDYDSLIRMGLFKEENKYIRLLRRIKNGIVSKDFYKTKNGTNYR